MKAFLLISKEFVLADGKYTVTITVYEVEKSKKFPEGIKAKFLLQDSEDGTARLLVDNHQPFGFHMHTKLPRDKDHREVLDVKDHEEALAFFMTEVERIIKNEEN
jgi:hypothetical protein